MLTLEQLRLIMPNLPVARGTGVLPFLEAAMAEFAIGTPARAAAFLAQIAHESGQLRFMEEIWGPTPAQGRYEPASSLATALGNTIAGDGRLFKGRGPIQLTGRANYQRFGALLGVDLIANPAQAAKPELAFRTAALFWVKNGLNDLADQANADAFTLITRRINGGVNGLADRQRFYATACSVLGVAAPSPGTMRSAPAQPVEPFTRGAEAMFAGRGRAKAAGATPSTSRRPAAKAAAATGRAAKKAASGTSKRPAAKAATADRRTAKKGAPAKTTRRVKRGVRAAGRRR